MEGYRFVRRQEVVFRDLDGLGHVNNAVYLTYLETARLDYLREVVGVRSLDELGIIVAEARVAFRSPASLGEVLDVGVRVSRIGSKSFDLEYELRGPGGRLVAEGATVQVGFDYERGETVPIPDEWRRAFESYEAREFAAA